MFEQADVGSIAAIADFQAALAGFAESAKQALISLDLEIRRAVEYVRVDRAQHWQNEIRRSYEAVARAKDELHRCLCFKSSENFTPSCVDEKKALQRAQQRLRNTEEKAEAVKHWSRAMQHELNEYAGRMTQFNAVLEGEVPSSMAVLDRILQTLDRYVATRGPGSLEKTALERPDSLLDSAAATTTALGSMARPTDPIEDSREDADRSAVAIPAADSSKLSVAETPSAPGESAAAEANSGSVEANR